MAKVVNLLSPAQRTKLLQIPDDFPEREIVRYYSLSPEDLDIIAEHRRSHNRLGFTVQLAYLRYPGRAWNPEEPIPPNILTYLARQIDEPPEVLAEYTRRDPTRREHLGELQRRFGFRSFSLRFYRQLSHWLMPIAMGTDEGMVLVEALIEELRTQRIIAPALSTLERLAWETRGRAQQQVFTTLTAFVAWRAKGNNTRPNFWLALMNSGGTRPSPRRGWNWQRRSPTRRWKCMIGSWATFLNKDNRSNAPMEHVGTGTSD